MSPGKKKILLLGGSYLQLPAIRMAKELGLYTILCDYLPDNPGKEFSDEYINASTTDRERILEIAKEKEIDYVQAYAADSAAPTAAYVSEKMGLPGNPFHAIKTLTEKHLFRKLLRDTGLNYPKGKSMTGEEIDEVHEMELEYPLVVKPVDSSGSKGVSLIQSFSEFKTAAEYAISASRSRRIIVEEYVKAKGAQLHGDGFVVNGELTFIYLGDQHFNTEINPFVPYTTTWPSVRPKETLERIHNDINKVLQKSGFKHGAINIEIRVTGEGEIYVMEIAPRSGGNFVPVLLKHATGYDMVEAGLKAAMGEKTENSEIFRKNASYFVLHSPKNGVLKKILTDPKISSCIVEQHQYVEAGETVHSFQNAGAAIGILLLLFPSRREMENIMRNINEYVKVEVE